ncbi:MAG: primosomal protein N' [Desulfofustis sp.]|nr:primosomal protein N' [Desulfofustis sp.]
MMILEVAVCAPVRQTYSYSAPAAGGDPAEGIEGFIGRRVLVPFGARPLIGYVVGESEESDSERGYEIKPLIEVIDSEGLFPPESVDLFRWVASYYHHPLGLVIKTALPSGLSAAPQNVISLVNPDADPSDYRSAQGDELTPWLLHLLSEKELRGRHVRAILASRKDRKDLDRLVAAGMVAVSTELRRDRVSSKMETCYQLNDALRVGLQEQGVLSSKEHRNGGNRLLSKAQRKSIDLLGGLEREFGGHGGVPRKEFVARYAYGARVVRTLIEQGVVTEHKRRVYRNPFGDLLPFYPTPGSLSDEQQEALDLVVAAMESESYQPLLLHGVTGSGKTEVYMRAAKRALELGKTVLVLVPEIALATQVEAHFISRFKDRVALLHSGLSQGERFDEWWRILSGAAGIVIGARSAVFAPLRHVGLIVVDEEHDSSFKQEDGLRYNARDLALVRGRQHDCVVVLGSATPAVTSYYHGRMKKYTLVGLSRRIGGRDLPETVLLDLKEAARIRNRAVPLFHPELKGALQKNLQAGGQSILLLNRRGFATSVICRACGTFVECRHCKVTMNLHKQKKILLCHYCGYQASINTSCVGCGSDDLHPVGFGTERVEAELQTLLPEARIARLDSDIAADRKRFLQILKAMQDRNIDVLIGTQIVAKGLHFPGVTLVGIIMADSGLGFPDYRAAEKTFQLITQVTGRAGRGDVPGRVIIQTMQPDHYAVALAAAQQYGKLVDTELNIRSGLGFPPYSRLVLIIIDNPNNLQAKRSASELHAGIQAWCRQHDPARTVTMLGPAPAPLEKLRDNYRWQILLKSQRLPELHGVTDWVVSGFKSRPGTRIHVDIDPENMM